jgi:hypothetical protein
MNSLTYEEINYQINNHFLKIIYKYFLNVKQIFKDYYSLRLQNS